MDLFPKTQEICLFNRKRQPGIIYWLNLIEKPRQVFDKKKWKDSALVRSRLVTRDLAGTRTSGRESGQNLLTDLDLCVSFQRKQSMSIYVPCMFEPICSMKKFTSWLLLILLPVNISCKYFIIILSAPQTKAKEQIYLGQNILIFWIYPTFSYNSWLLESSCIFSLYLIKRFWNQSRSKKQKPHPIDENVGHIGGCHLLLKCFYKGSGSSSPLRYITHARGLTLHSR